jgi:hypothetical protein
VNTQDRNIAAMAEDSLSIYALAVLAQEDPQKLQLHADKIRHLEFHGDDAMYYGLFKHTRFPMLECISLDASNQKFDEKLLESYLQPALKIFHFHRGPISDTFLEKLQVCISYLLSFVISSPDWQ